MALFNEKVIDTHITCPYCAGEGMITNLGYYLQTLRKQAHLTQKEMGEYSGYSRTQIQGVERGLRNPSPILLDSYKTLPVSQVLRLPIKTLFSR